MLTADTKRSIPWRTRPHYSTDRSYEGWLFQDILLKKEFSLHREFEDAIIVFDFNTIITDFSSNDLTQLAAEMSTVSFAEEWDQEDDNYWNSYLD